MRAGQAPLELADHSGVVHALAVLHHGRAVTGGSDAGVLRIWDWGRPGCLPLELGRNGNQVRA